MKNRSKPDAFGLGTRAMHAGQHPDPSTGAILTPIYATSTYVQESPGIHKVYGLSRKQNRTRMAYERYVAHLESCVAGLTFSSGLAAASTVLDLLESGSQIMAMDDLYGSNYQLFDKVRRRSVGLGFSFSDLNDAAVMETALKPNTRMIWAKTLTSLMAKLVDLTNVAAFAEKHDLILVADNTFCSHMIQRPIEYGADTVTKNLKPHSDIVGGTMIAGSQELAEQRGFLRISMGAVAAAFDSSFAMRLPKIFHLRTTARFYSTLVRAKWLEKHPLLNRVVYPGLNNHLQYAPAKRQTEGLGDFISIEIEGGLIKSKHMLVRCKSFALTESRRGVENPIKHSAIMTRASVPAANRRRLGISDGLAVVTMGWKNSLICWQMPPLAWVSK